MMGGELLTPKQKVLRPAPRTLEPACLCACAQRHAAAAACSWRVPGAPHVCGTWRASEGAELPLHPPTTCPWCMPRACACVHEKRSLLNAFPCTYCGASVEAYTVILQQCEWPNSNRAYSWAACMLSVGPKFGRASRFTQTHERSGVACSTAMNAQPTHASAGHAYMHRCMPRHAIPALLVHLHAQLRRALLHPSRRIQAVQRAAKTHTTSSSTTHPKPATQRRGKPSWGNP